MTANNNIGIKEFSTTTLNYNYTPPHGYYFKQPVLEFLAPGWVAQWIYSVTCDRTCIHKKWT